MDAFMGSIMICGFNYPPVNWGTCNGATIPIQQNSALFALLGTQFGGNGTTNFMLPDLQGRVPVGFGGSANHPIGEQFGQENIGLTQSQLPSHTHTLAEVHTGQTVTATAAATVHASDTQGSVNKPNTTSYWAKGFDATNSSVLSNYATTKDVTMASDAVQVSVSPSFQAANLAIGPSGSGLPFSLAQPSLSLNYIICLYGIFPSRQ